MDAFEKFICNKKIPILEPELAVARACAHSPEIQLFILLVIYFYIIYILFILQWLMRPEMF